MSRTSQNYLIATLVIVVAASEHFMVGYLSVAWLTKPPYFPIVLKNPAFPWMSGFGVNPAWGEGLVLIAGAAALCWAADRMKLA